MILLLSAIMTSLTGGNRSYRCFIGIGADRCRYVCHTPSLVCCRWHMQGDSMISSALLSFDPLTIDMSTPDS